MSNPSPTIDRAARDVLAELVIAAANGNEPPDGYESRPPIHDSPDSAVSCFEFLPDFVFFELIPDGSGDAQTWDWLRRVVALLRTDLPLVRIRRYTRQPRQTVALGGVAMILLGGAASWWLGQWWPLLTAWGLAGVGLILYMRHVTQPVDPEVEQLGAFAPFRSAAQWARYRNLVADGEIVYPHRAPTEPKGEQFSLSWLLFGALFGTLLLPAMLRRSQFNVEVVEREDL